MSRFPTYLPSEESDTLINTWKTSRAPATQRPAHRARSSVLTAYVADSRYPGPASGKACHQIGTNQSKRQEIEELYLVCHYGVSTLNLQPKHNRSAEASWERGQPRRLGWLGQKRCRGADTLLSRRSPATSYDVMSPRAPFAALTRRWNLRARWTNHTPFIFHVFRLTLIFYVQRAGQVIKTRQLIGPVSLLSCVLSYAL